MSAIKFPALLGLSLDRPIRTIRHWWLCRIEDHYLICANAEAHAVREAQQNVRFYQKQAALARSARND